MAGGRAAIPEAGQPIWSIFLDLSASRTYHMGGPNPIAFAEIEAYAALNRWPLAPHHVAFLRALDAAYLAFAHPARDGRPPAAARHTMTPAAFDAVFS